MKTYKEFMQESSLSRIKSKSDKGGMAILSGSRGDKSKKENQARAKQLDKDIRGKGLPGATKVTGSYVEKDKSGKETKVKERSHVVTSGKMGKRKFKKAVKSLGKKYGQDSVLTQTKKSGRLQATRKGGLGKAKGIGVGKFKPQGKNPEGQSQIKGKTLLMDNKIDNSNWREDYKKYTTNKMELDLLENGPKSLSQSWHLQALYSNWKKVKGIKDPEPLNLQSSFKEWNDRVDT